MPRPILSFKHIGLGREVASLGGEEIGAVEEGMFGPRIGAYWSVMLPSLVPHMRVPAITLDAARKGLEMFVTDWLRATGCLYGDQHVIRHCDGERRQADDRKRRVLRRIA